MEKAAIVVGEEYGVREPPRPGVDLQRVRVLAAARSGKWRVCFLGEPTPGLEDYVHSRNIVVRWEERKTFLRDEERLEALKGMAEQDWPGFDHPLDDAVSLVYETTGEQLSFHRGLLSGPPDAVQRVADRAGVPCPTGGAAFVDRNGTMWVGPTDATELAKAFAAREPATVLLRVDNEQRQYEIEAAEPGNSHTLGLIERWRAGWAVVRSWAGLDEALVRRDAEISRLREIIDRTIWDLRKRGLDDMAARLERQVGGR